MTSPRARGATLLLLALCADLARTLVGAIVFERPINDAEGRLLGTLRVREGQEPADKVYRFGVKHKQSAEFRRALLQHVCAEVPCTRTEAVVFERAINDAGGKLLGTLRVQDNEEPADVVYRFCKQHGQQSGFRQALLQHVCAAAQCNRMEAVLFERPINDAEGRLLGTLRVMDKEEPADAVFRFGTQHKQPFAFRQALLQHVCATTTCNRAEAVMFDRPISAEGGKVLGTLRITEQQEPAHAVHEFCTAHAQSLDFERAVLAHVCSEPSAVCEHKGPLLFANAIAHDNGTSMGTLRLYGDEEPADTIFRFCNERNRTSEFRKNLLKHVCGLDRVHCRRAVAVLFERQISDAGGARLVVLDTPEPVDQVDVFCRAHNLTVSFRQFLLSKVCDVIGHKLCTRAEPLLFSQPITDGQGKKIGDVEVFEGQDVVDRVYAFCRKHDLIDNMETILAHACNASERVQCTRQTPREVLFTLNPTWLGLQYRLEYAPPEDEWQCDDLGGRGTKCEHYTLTVARRFCSTYMPAWQSCEADVTAALEKRLAFFESCKWKTNDVYAHLGLPKSADNATIVRRYQKLSSSLPNATKQEQDIQKKLLGAYNTLTDKGQRENYDQPCIPVFGSLCGKRTPDGGMQVLMENDVLSIKVC